MSATAVPASPTVGFHRRGLLVAAVVLVLGVSAIGAWGFIRPTSSGITDLSAVQLGSVTTFPPGSVNAYRVTLDRQLNQIVDPVAFGRSVEFVSLTASGDRFFYVVHLPDGEFTLLVGRSPHRGGAVRWAPESSGQIDPRFTGVFVEPRHGEEWTIDGTRIFGPAPRDLDRLDWRVDAGVLIADLSELHRGARGTPAPPRYDVNDPDWPTSGWPSAVLE